MPCPFTGPNMFCACPNFLSHSIIWLHLVPLQNLLCRHKNQFYGMQIIFLSVTKCLWLPQYVNTFMPCPFTGRKMFCAGPIFLCQIKNLSTYCASHKHFVPDKKMICVQFWKRHYLIPCPFTGPRMFCAGPNFLSQPKNLTAFSASSKTFVLAQKTILLNANHLFVWHKMFVTGKICK